MPEMITSVQNDKIKELYKLLRNRKFREESGLFVLEGATLAREAVLSENTIHSAFCTDLAEKNYPEAVHAVWKKAKNTYIVQEHIPEKLSDQKVPQGIFVVVEYPKENTKAVLGNRVLILDGIQDPGNLGAIARSALAFGFDTLILSQNTVDAYSPKSQRAAMGALLRCRIIDGNITKDAVQMLRDNGFCIIAAAVGEDSLLVNNVVLSGKMALLIGSEAHGVSLDILKCCDSSVMIPMDCRTESLNAAVAAGIIMWEIRSQDGAK